MLYFDNKEVFKWKMNNNVYIFFRIQIFTSNNVYVADILKSKKNIEIKYLKLLCMIFLLYFHEFLILNIIQIIKL